MAVVSSAELYDKRRRSKRLPNVTDYTRVFQVVVDSRTDTEATVAAASGVPALAAAHPDNSQAKAASQDVACVDPSGLKWEVTVNYSTDLTPQQLESSPMARPINWRWDFVRYEEVVEKDRDGDPVETSAGEPFDPLPVRDRTRPVLVITRNEAQFVPATVETYVGKVNEREFFGAAANTLKLDSIQPTPVTEGTTNFWSVTYAFHYKPNTWALEVLDFGSYERPNKEGDKRNFSEEEGESGRAKLDGEGTKLADDADPVYLSFDVYEEVDFNKLRFY